MHISNLKSSLYNRNFLSSLLALTFVYLISGCDLNPHDPNQVPIITVSTGLTPSISWIPQGAARISIYPGTEELENYDPLTAWHINKDTLENQIQSPVVFAQARLDQYTEWRPATALLNGEVYTVVIYRDDPRGTGSGFQNTHNIYKSTQTFVATP